MVCANLTTVTIGREIDLNDPPFLNYIYIPEQYQYIIYNLPEAMVSKENISVSINI